MLNIDGPTKNDRITRLTAVIARIDADHAHHCTGEIYSPCGRFSAPCGTCEAWHDTAEAPNRELAFLKGRWQKPEFFTYTADDIALFARMESGDLFDSDIPF